MSDAGSDASSSSEGSSHSDSSSSSSLKMSEEDIDKDIELLQSIGRYVERTSHRISRKIHQSIQLHEFHSLALNRASTQTVSTQTEEVTASNSVLEPRVLTTSGPPLPLLNSFLPRDAIHGMDPHQSPQIGPLLAHYEYLSEEERSSLLNEAISILMHSPQEDKEPVVGRRAI